MEQKKSQIINKYFIKFRLDQKKKITVFFILGLIIIFSIRFFEDHPGSQSKKFYLDSSIPTGFVLVPVDIFNGNSLATMIGKTGVVDLFLTEGGKKTTKVAARVKIVQATEQTDSFAVLLKEDLSQKLLSFRGPFFAVVQNPKIQSQEIFQSGKNRITINYQN